MNYTQTKDLFFDEKDVNKSITQSNFLIRASYSLSLIEKRLFFLTVSKINPTKWKQQWSFKVTAKDWQAAFGDFSSTNTYRDMKTATKLLMQQPPMRIMNENNKDIDVHWISSAEYLDREGAINIEISEKLRFYLAFMMLYDFGFTTLAMKNVGKLNSCHAIRVYELLMQFYDDKKKSGWLKITPDEIIEMFKLPESYKKNRSSIKQKILIPSIKKINESSNLICELEISKKNGRAISQYLFTFKEQKR